MLPAGNVLFVASQDAVEKAGPDFGATIEKVQESLTLEVMQELNARVSIDREKPEEVAPTTCRRASCSSRLRSRPASRERLRCFFRGPRGRSAVGAAAILDIDGTLVDTNYHHAIAWSRAFREHGLSPELWRIHRHIGMGGDQLVARAHRRGRSRSARR